MTETQDDILTYEVKDFLEVMQGFFKDDIPEQRALVELSMQVTYLAFLLDGFMPLDQKALINFLSSLNLLRRSQIEALLSTLDLKDV
jgi:hypothetical protein